MRTRALCTIMPHTVKNRKKQNSPGRDSPSGRSSRPRSPGDESFYEKEEGGNKQAKGQENK
jgi:hypothetical protein